MMHLGSYIARNVSRYISTRELQVQNNVITFDAILRKSAFAFFKRCLDLNNSFIASLLNSGFL